jgi:hypothetical protein
VGKLEQWGSPTAWARWDRGGGDGHFLLCSEFQAWLLLFPKDTFLEELPGPWLWVFLWLLILRMA